MSGKYVPPSLRNRSEPVPNFPQLSTRQPLVAPSPMAKAYSALATEWNDKEEEDRVQKEFQTELDRRNREREEATRRNKVSLHREYHGSDEYIYSAEEQPLMPASKVDADGWQTVEKKAKKEWTLDEQIDRKERYLQTLEKGEEDSVWGSNANEEWGYRDRRAAS
jgi:hypothetical protein